jgi:hypothetical protein
MPTHNEVNAATTELYDAMVESIEAGKAEDDAKVRKIKAHYRLQQARDVIRNITFTY